MTLPKIIRTKLFLFFCKYPLGYYKCAIKEFSASVIWLCGSQKLILGLPGASKQDMAITLVLSESGPKKITYILLTHRHANWPKRIKIPHFLWNRLLSFLVQAVLKNLCGIFSLFSIQQWWSNLHEKKKEGGKSISRPNFHLGKFILQRNGLCNSKNRFDHTQLDKTLLSWE